MSIENTSSFKKWKKKWSDESLVSIWDYVSYNIHPETVLIILHFIQPKICHIEGHYLLDDFYAEEVFNEMKLKLSAKQVEADLNRIRMYDLFGHAKDVDDTIFLHVAERIKSSWKGNLSVLFPNINFTVEVNNDSEDYGPSVTFFQT